MVYFPPVFLIIQLFYFILLEKMDLVFFITNILWIEPIRKILQQTHKQIACFKPFKSFPVG